MFGAKFVFYCRPIRLVHTILRDTGRWSNSHLMSCFHAGKRKYAKMYTDRENLFAHSVLEHSLKPYKIFRFEDEKDEEHAFVQAPTSAILEHPERLTSDEILNQLAALTRYCTLFGVDISEERFRHFILHYCDMCPTLSDTQILASLQHLGHLTCESVRCPNYMELWNALDCECCKRIEAWDHEQLLLVCDAWYALNLARICDFVWEALRKLGRKVSRLSPENLVHTMFFCNVLRKSIFEMIDFEVNLLRHVDQMSLQELGVMSMGFFKTQTPIRNPELNEHLCKRLVAELSTVEDITLVAILKVLRYSLKLTQIDLMSTLLDKLCGHIERISLLSCLHVALMGCDFQYCHEPVMELVLQRFNRDISQTRLKDLERICLAIGLFNYSSPSGVAEELCTNIVKELDKRIAEIIQHPRCFPNCLHFLSQRGFYDVEMISTALDKRYIRHAYGSNILLMRPIFHLDGYAKINLKDNYDGHQLSDKLRRSMGKMLTQYIPERNIKYKLSATDRILLEIKETTECYIRPVAFKQLLPHYDRPDIVICFNRATRKAVPVAAECPEDYSGVILTREELLGATDSDNVDTIALVVVGWNNQIRGKDTFTGHFDLKLQQLSLLGHKCVTIPWHKWAQQETQSDRLQYIKRVLAPHLLI